MFQTSIQNERSIVFGNGCKVEIYVTTPYARYIDIGAMTGNVSFVINYGVFRGEIDGFQDNDSYMVATSGTLQFNTIELQPEVYHELLGQSLSYRDTINGAEISDITTELLTKNIFRLTAADDYGNDRTLTIYNASTNTFSGLPFVSGRTSEFQFIYDCLYDSSDRLYLFQDEAGYNFVKQSILGRPDSSDILIGRPDATDTVIGRPITDTFSAEAF